MSVRKERGAALIVSMVFLLVLAIIGLAGIEVSGLEEKMAGNLRDRNSSFQAAEAALRDAEDYLSSLVVLPAFDGTDGLYALPADGSKRWLTVDWGSSTAVKSYSGPGFDELAASSAYIIENLAEAGTNDSLELGAVADSKRYYRITARAVGLTDNSVVILQSVYKR